MKRVLNIFLILLAAMSSFAQFESFEEYRKKLYGDYNSYVDKAQEEYNAFRKQVNDNYAEFLRQAWEAFDAAPADTVHEEKTQPPVVYQEPEPIVEPAPQPKPQPEEDIEEPIVRDTVKVVPIKKDSSVIKVKPVRPDSVPINVNIPVAPPKPIQIPIDENVVVVAPPSPAPEPIAPVQPKEEQQTQKVVITYYNTPISISFPVPDGLRLSALSENAIADAWKELADEKYDITVKTALDARKDNALCDWAYMQVLQKLTEKHYGDSNEAVLMQAFLMTQSGYSIRLGMDGKKLYLLVASQYNIYNLRYFTIDSTRFYMVKGDCDNLHICKAKFDKEKSMSLQLQRLPMLNIALSDRRTLTSKKGVTAQVSVNKNMIDFFEHYPVSCINGDFTTRWVAYANTPLDKAVKKNLYPVLQKTVEGMSEKDAVGIILNWVQTAFVYGYDDEIWGGDRAFFAQETLYYPYSDCEDRAILFSRLVRDILGLDVALLYYPGHLAAAVAFKTDVNGDFLICQNKKYVVCDPTYINAPVGKTMPNMDNKQAKVIILK